MKQEKRLVVGGTSAQSKRKLERGKKKRIGKSYRGKIRNICDMDCDRFQSAVVGGRYRGPQGGEGLFLFTILLCIHLLSFCVHPKLSKKKNIFHLLSGGGLCNHFFFLKSIFHISGNNLHFLPDRLL